MKKFFIILSVVGILSSCSKDKDPDPVSTDYGAQVAGTYQINKAEFDGAKVTLPSNGVSMSVKLTRISDASADLILTSTVNGNNTSGGGTVTLTKSGSKITIKDSASDIGYVDGKTIHLEGKDANGVAYKVDGNK